MLTSGAAADTYSPSQPTPGAGAAGSGSGAAPGSASKSVPVSEPGQSPASTSNAPISNLPTTNPSVELAPGGAAKPADHRVAPPPTKCQAGGGQKGAGHGKHGCGGDGGNGGNGANGGNGDG